MCEQHHGEMHRGERRTRESGAFPASRMCSRAPWLWLAIALASGCTHHAAAKALPENPPLEMPAPPPRDVEPSGVGPSGVEPPPAPSSAPQESPRSTPPRARPAPSRPEPAKAEPVRPEAPPAEAPKPPPEEPPKPPTTLQTTPATAEGDVERAVRATLTRADVDLRRINYRALNADARTQYDTAKSFIRQADQAIKAKNLVFAKSLADKAAALATQLGGK
jgi:hypothetical protein